MKAIVTVKAMIEVRVDGNWDEDCKLAQIYRDAIRQSTESFLAIAQKNSMNISHVEVKKVLLEK